MWESMAYELGVGTHMPDATIAAEGVEQAATTPPTHEVPAGGREGNTDGDWAMHIEEFLRNERQVTPTEVQERKGRVYMTVDEKRYALAQLEEHATSHGYGADPAKGWGKHVLATGVDANEVREQVRSTTIWQLALRFLTWRRGRPLRVPAGPTVSPAPPHHVATPQYTDEHVRVAQHLRVTPELLVTPVPPDDFCLLYTYLAARAGPAWMESRSTAGYLTGEAMRDLHTSQEKSAKQLKRRLIERTRAAGKRDEAARLASPGRGGWPGEDNFPELAELLECKVQCFSLDNRNCLLPHRTEGSSSTFRLNVGHFKDGHFVLLAGSHVQALE